MRFFTEQKVDVTKRLNDGRTGYAKTKEAAERKANERRSYFYMLLDDKGTPVGYGIPQ